MWLLVQLCYLEPFFLNFCGLFEGGKRKGLSITGKLFNPQAQLVPVLGPDETVLASSLGWECLCPALLLVIPKSHIFSVKYKDRWPYLQQFS